jgi:hypothetical protein
MSNKSLETLIDELKKLAIRSHYYCEDSWYSCPLAADGCANDSIDKTKCNCYADEHNKKVEEIYEKIKDNITSLYCKDIEHILRIQRKIEDEKIRAKIACGPP